MFFPLSLSAQTGDNSPVLTWLAVGLLAIAFVVIVLVMIRRRNGGNGDAAGIQTPIDSFEPDPVDDHSLPFQTGEIPRDIVDEQDRE